MGVLIEDFNGYLERLFLSKGAFNNLEHVRIESKIFRKRCDDGQNWKNQKKSLEDIPARRIPKDFEIYVKNLLLTKGKKVRFILEVEKGGKISMLNEDFDVSESLLYEYVWVTLNTREEKLMVLYTEKKKLRKQGL